MFKLYREKYPGAFWFTILLAIVLPLAPAVMILVAKSDASRLLFSDIMAPLYNLIGVAGLVFAAVQSRKVSRQQAWGWGLLAFAQLVYAVGDVLWAYSELVLRIAPYPSAADAAYLLSYPFFLLGILTMPAKQLTKIDWVKRALDLSIVMITADLLFWIYLIRPLMATMPATPVLEAVLSLSYPLGGLALVFSVLIAIYYRSQNIAAGSIWLLMAGVVTMVVADSFFSYQSLQDMYSGGGVIDYLWVFSALLVALSGLHQGVDADMANRVESPRLNVFVMHEKFSRVAAFFPYLCVVIAFFLLQRFHDSAEIIHTHSLFVMVGSVIGLVVIRQVIVLIENDHLLARSRRALEKESDQASLLNKINLTLQEEIYRRMQVEEQLSHDALHDGLTGLANRALLMERLRQAIEISRREASFHYSVLFLDVDNFKVINDSLGHNAGDRTLIMIADRLLNCTRSADTVARLGGDEFVLLLMHTSDDDNTIPVARRILTELQQPMPGKFGEISVMCSIGIVEKIEEYDNPEDVLRDADLALYHAKEMGKARYEVFNLDLRTSAMTRLEIESDLRRALANNEFVLHYQPIYSLDQNTISGVEALVRWRHPQRGMIAPKDFIPVAESCGLILPIGDWVLRTACTQLNQWHKVFPELNDLIINVNISGKQVTQPDFVERVEESLTATGINPHRVMLEITENALIENQSLANDLLTRLRGLGVSFAIDDFGTGYSSLGYLFKFSVSTIKIDKTFVREIARGGKGFEIVKLILLMAREVNIDSVAEGIETQEQLDKLKELACNYGQGNYLSRPVDAATLTELLRRQAAVHAPSRQFQPQPEAA